MEATDHDSSCILWVTVRCYVLQCVAVCYTYGSNGPWLIMYIMSHGPLLCVAVCCSVLHVWKHLTARLWMSHVTHKHTLEWVITHTCMSHVAHTGESWRTYGCVMAHIWMSHGANLNTLCRTYASASCRAYEWVMSKSHRLESWLACEWVMSLTWTRRVAYINQSYRLESCRAYKCDKSSKWRHVAYVLNESWRTDNLRAKIIGMSDVAHLCYITHPYESWRTHNLPRS